MSRAEVILAIKPHVFMVDQYRAVSRSTARALLGEELYHKLTNDEIRGVGPTPSTFYPWNVEDYLLTAIRA